MFRKLTLAGMLAAGLVMALAAPAQAQRAYAPRMFPDQQTHYLRFTVNFNSCPLPVAAGNCSFRVGALPYNAFMLRGYQQVTVAFTSTTTDTLALGTTSGSANVVAAQSTHAATAATVLTLANPGLGLVGAGVTGNGATQTAQLGGGFDLWATIAYTGATAAAAGQAIIVLEYAAPNDGSCAPVPANATAPAC